MAPENNKKNIVIVGGGIIGCTTAYFLTRHPSFDPAKHTITLLESTKIAGGASGKAGGLLALWAYPANIVPLSYRLHAELAKEHGGDKRWGYRQIHCGQLEAKGRRIEGDGKGVANGGAAANGKPKQAVSLEKRSEKAMGLLRAAGIPKELDWVASDAATGYDEMGTPETTAQVHPLHFTTSMAALAEEAGVKVLTDTRVTSINRTSDSKSPSVESVSYTTKQDTTTTNKNQTLPADHIIVAAGPWTRNLIPSAPISGLRAHSVTITPSKPISAYALFTSIRLPSHFSPRSENNPGHVSPEIYARPNNEAYACGEGDRLVPLPDTTADVAVDDERCQDIIDYVGSISDELRDGEVTARQACYLPVCGGAGGPFIGEVDGCKGLIVASGHSCWGIQNAPATGKLVSEVVFDGAAKSAKLGGLDPKRMMGAFKGM